MGDIQKGIHAALASEKEEQALPHLGWPYAESMLCSPRRANHQAPSARRQHEHT